MAKDPDQQDPQDPRWGGLAWSGWHQLDATAAASLLPPGPELLTPDKVTELLITVGNVAHTFQRGHRIRLEVSSSNFPRFLPNSNTGGDEVTINAAEMKRAVNRVFHDEDHASCLILPCAPRD